MTRKPQAAPAPAEASQIVLRKLDDLIPYARNARQHSASQVETIKGSIAEFGFTNPVLVDGMSIVAGHGRCLAARGLYDAGVSLRFPSGAAIPDGMVPVIDCTGWSEAQRRAYILADNRIALSSTWDMEMVKVELSDLKAMDFDLGLTGFDLDEISVVLDPDGAGDDEGGIEDPPDDKYQEQFGVIVICTDESQQAAMYERLSGEGLNCKVVTT